MFDAMKTRGIWLLLSSAIVPVCANRSPRFGVNERYGYVSIAHSVARHLPARPPRASARSTFYVLNHSEKVKGAFCRFRSYSAPILTRIN
jgi:hypothetical protein